MRSRPITAIRSYLSTGSIGTQHPAVMFEKDNLSTIVNITIGITINTK